MGFDIIGIKPTNDTGKCFSGNIQTWVPLWRFICQNCDDILTVLQMEEGFANNGIKISARQTKLIIKRLENIVNTEGPAETDKTQSPFKESEGINLLEVQKVLSIDSLPNNQNLRSYLIEFLEFAFYSGGFKIW